MPNCTELQLQSHAVILSLSHKFLFIHVYKVAGTSIVRALGGADVRREVRLLAPENQGPFLAGLGIDPRVAALQDHTFARDLRPLIDPTLFRRLFKFGFVRNPWDLQLSLYRFNVEKPHVRNADLDFSTFERYIMCTPKDTLPHGVQKRFLFDTDGAQIVDFIGRYENLTADFAEVCRRIGIEPIELPHHNATSHGPWASYYTREMFEHERKRMAVDVETFGYPDDPAFYGIT